MNGSRQRATRPSAMRINASSATCSRKFRSATTKQVRRLVPAGTTIWPEERLLQSISRRTEMGLPDFRQDGLLPAGIHAATLQEVQIRFGSCSAISQRKQEQLVKVVEAALAYVTIKRVLLWGSFISTKPSRTIWIIRWW